jgi:hypothetical protein
MKYQNLCEEEQEIYVGNYKYQYFTTSRIPKFCNINPLTPELNPSAQRCLTRFVTGDFAT